MFAVALLAVCALGGIATFSEDSDAATDLGTYHVGVDGKNKSSETALYSKVQGDVANFEGDDVGVIYVSEGAYIFLFNLGTSPDQFEVHDEAQLKEWGLTKTEDPEGDTVDGNLTKTGRLNIQIDSKYDGRLIMLEVVPKSSTPTPDAKPVTAITITGGSGVTIGNSITLEASVDPSDAADCSVTWSIQSGSAFVSIEADGSSCTVTGKATGTATIRCDANDGSGTHATYDVAVTTIPIPTTMHTVTFDLAGGAADYSETKVADGKTVAEPEAPTRDGFTFDGWYLGEEKYDFKSAVTSDITLVAHWADKSADDSDDDKEWLWVLFAILAALFVLAVFVTEYIYLGIGAAAFVVLAVLSFIGVI